MGKSITKNYLYNVSYQILILLTSLITTPYLSRVLGADGIGTYSYTTSIVSYFMIVASLGIADCAQREIAYHQDSKDEQSRIFFKMLSLRALTTTISLLVYYYFVYSYIDNQALYWIQAVNLWGLIFDITWFFQGMEEFKKIVLRNTLVRVLNIICIFAFVKEAEDLSIYIFIMGFMNLVANISMWMYLPKYLCSFDKREWKPFRYLGSAFLLFLPQVAIHMYTVMDKTMIGTITGSSFENGYYEQAEKIAKLSLLLVTSLGNVMLPKIAYSFMKQDWNTLNQHMMYAFRFVWFLGIPLMLGLMGIAGNLVPWFLGPGYENVIVLLQVFSGLIIMIGMSNIIGIQYFIPTQKQSLLTVAVTAGAVINFGLNFILIPRFMSNGAAVASLIAETVITLIMLFMVRRNFSLKLIFCLSLKYWCSGIVMFIAIYILGLYLQPSMINTIILIAIGTAVYGIMLFALKDSYYLEVINKMRKMIGW